MKLTEELIQEHEKFKTVLSIMNRMSEDIKSRKVFYTDDLENIVKSIFSYWDKCHCFKEEKVLFPVLISEDLITENDLIETMIQEHITLRSYLKEIDSSLVNCKIGNPFSCAKLADCMTAYVNVLQIHMQNEETIFFPLADKVLSEEKQNHILEQFEIIEKKYAHKRIYDQFQVSSGKDETPLSNRILPLLDNQKMDRGHLYL